MRSYHCSNTNGKYQEQESAPLVREFLADTGMTAAQGYASILGGAAFNTQLGAFGVDLTQSRLQAAGIPGFALLSY